MGASTLNKKELFRLHMGEVKNDYATLMGDCEYYESQIESLQDENFELRKQVDDLMHEHERLEQGNARLLELIRTMVYCYKANEYDGYDCDGCVMNGADAHVSIDRYFACDGLQESLRELGIENG